MVFWILVIDKPRDESVMNTLTSRGIFMKSFGEFRTNAALFLSLFGALTCGAEVDTRLASKAIGEMAGVYKQAFANGMVSGEQYRSEDVVEIMRYAPDAIYFRIHLEFFNGHSCGIYGVAKYEQGEFIYKNNDDLSKNKVCTLRIRRENQWLKITDVDERASSTCRFYCGMRGSLSDYQINMEKKRKIKYLPLILKSRQYRAAVEEFAVQRDIQ